MIKAGINGILSQIFNKVRRIIFLLTAPHRSHSHCEKLRGPQCFMLGVEESLTSNILPTQQNEV
jgi:hypothetical protein